MVFQHKELAAGRWKELSLAEQMGNIGSEIERAISWKNKGNKEKSLAAFFRGLELVDLTIADPKHIKRLREITRAREALVDYFMYDNIYGSSDEKWQKYFFAFAWMVRNKK